MGILIFPLLFAFVGAIAFNSEFTQGTRQFLLNRPMATWKIFITKVLIGICVMISLSVLSYYVFYIPNHKMSVLLGFDKDIVPIIPIYILLVNSTVVYFSILLCSLIFKNTIVSIIFFPVVLFLDIMLCLPVIVVFFYFGLDPFNSFFVLSLSFMIMVLGVFCYVIWDYSVVRESGAVKAVLATLAGMLILFYAVHGVFTVISYANLKEALETAQKEGISLSAKETYYTDGNAALERILKLSEEIEKKYLNNIYVHVTYEATSPCRMIWRDEVDDKKREEFGRSFTEGKEVLDFLSKCNVFTETEASKTYGIEYRGCMSRIFEVNDFLLVEKKNYSGVLNNALCCLKINRILQSRYGDRYIYPRMLLESVITMVPSEKQFEKILKQTLDEYVKDELTEKRFINGYTCFYGDLFGTGNKKYFYTAEELGFQRIPEKFAFNLYRNIIGVPLLNRDAAYFINFYAERLRLCNIPYYKLDRKYIEEDNREDMPSYIISRYMGNRVLYSYNRIRATDEYLKLSLALKVYKVTHGEYPGSLDKLVPEFMDKLPLDPFSGNNFIYERKGNGFTVYSVGKNGVDDKSIKDDIGTTCEL
ncbi:MAG TPA: hypothetical protein DET40_11085 [Lentisphaeria bacterium]|nr:MAG: hypothetical protein A2X45_20105 [Lentisphaerae bacterium GWF2_50_93]HCE44082.1 hypothetical protein [Lentisphaeria bacterium]